jgi:membrane protein YqaA with SNARE-associated domain
MQLQVGDVRVGIRFESLIWFTILTAVGTVLGGIAYSWFEFYLPNLLPKNALTKGSKNPATP